MGRFGDLLLSTTKPFRTGANILAQNWGSALTGKDMSQSENQGGFLKWLAGGITPEEQQVINDKPYLSALKSGAGMASTLAPFASQSLRTMQFAANPLKNRLAQLLSQGGLEGTMGGLGWSREGKEVQDMLTGGLIGAGGEVAMDYLVNPQFRKMLSDASTFEGPNGVNMYKGALGDDVDPKGTILKRRGDIDSNGSYFSTGEGLSTYFDEYDPEVKTYSIPSDTKIVSSDTQEAKEVLKRALQDKNNSKEAISAIKESLEDGFIDYRMNDDIPSIVNAAKEMGYDGIKVWENDSIGSPDSIFLWNTKKINNPLQATLGADDIPINTDLTKIKDPYPKDNTLNTDNLAEFIDTTNDSNARTLLNTDAPEPSYLPDDELKIVDSLDYDNSMISEGKIDMPEGGLLDTVNPTGSIFTEYTPEKRATTKLAGNITTLDKTMGRNPDEMITIYRGAPNSQKEINPGDFITTNYQLAKDYAGNGHVLEKKVRLGDILDDILEPLGGEYLFRPSKDIQGLRNSAKELRGGFKEILKKSGLK